MKRDIWNAIIKEHFNLQDTITRRCLVTVNEADQNQILSHLANKLYEKIVANVTDIDFGGIPNSRGDITKIPNYLELVDCLNIIHDLLVESKQATQSVDIIFKAIDNVKKDKAMWQKAYQLECEMPVVFYNTICLSIVSATSLMISSTVEFIKDGTTETIEMSISRASKNQSKDSLLFKNLTKFNDSCKKGDIEKTMEALLKSQRSVKEDAIQEGLFTTILTATIVVSLTTLVIPILHELTSMLYSLRQSVADYLAGEADVIRLNALKLEYDTTKTPAEKKKIAKKQNDIADKFKKWSDKLTIKSTKANKEAEAMVKKDKEEKYDLDDVMDEMPDSGSIF